LARLAGQARCFVQIREDTRFYASVPIPILRKVFLEMGRRLAELAVLDSEEDIFHLTFDELQALGGSWPPSAQSRMQLRSAFERRRAKRSSLESVPLIDPRLVRDAADETGMLVSGSPASTGSATGTVRVLHDASEFGKLQRGEILVAPYTDPSWTPLFRKAGAVVTDYGGAASHAAIVAREYGLPAVMGTSNATTVLKDGQNVRVDGARGTVSVAGRSHRQETGKPS
jgi:pyruvate,water dikinase